MPVNQNKVVRKEVSKNDPIGPKTHRDFNMNDALTLASWNHYVAILNSRKLFGTPTGKLLEDIVNDSRNLGLIR